MADDFAYCCLSCEGTFFESTLTACPYCGSGNTVPAETVGGPPNEVLGDTLICAYCGETHPRQFFYLRDSLDDPDPICWGCSDEVERGTLAPHYPDDEVVEEAVKFDFADDDDGRDDVDYYGRPHWLRY